MTNPCKSPQVRAFLCSTYLNVCFASSTSQCRLWESLQTFFVFSLLWLHWFLAIIFEVPTTVLPQIIWTWHNLTWRTLFLVEFMVYSLKFFKAFKVSSSWGLLWPILKIIINSFPFLTYIFISLHSTWQLLLCFNLCLFLMES